MNLLNTTGSSKCDNPIIIKLTEEKQRKLGEKTVPVSCGKCYNCKKRRVAQWSIRLMKELEVSTSSYFVTLTYDTFHVPISENGFMTLCKNSKQDAQLKKSGSQSDRSIQGFFKRLRYYEEEFNIMYDRKVNKVIKRKKLRFYAAGEYGSLRKRPHYHFIVFNLSSIDSIRKAWATAIVEKGITVDYIPFGGYDIQEVNNNTIDYTLKYICKESFKKLHKNDDRIPEFSLMSKGLGKNFLTPEIESFYNRRLDINYTVNQKGHKVALPRYYRDKLLSDETKEDAMGVIKRNIDFLTEQEEEIAKRKGINIDKLKQMGKFARQSLMNNYSSRNID